MEAVEQTEGHMAYQSSFPPILKQRLIKSALALSGGGEQGERWDVQVYCVITRCPITPTTSTAVARIANLAARQRRESRRGERLVDRRQGTPPRLAKRSILILLSAGMAPLVLRPKQALTGSNDLSSFSLASC